MRGGKKSSVAAGSRPSSPVGKKGGRHRVRGGSKEVVAVGVSPGDVLAVDLDGGQHVAGVGSASVLHGDPHVAGVGLGDVQVVHESPLFVPSVARGAAGAGGAGLLGRAGRVLVETAARRPVSLLLGDRSSDDEGASGVRLEEELRLTAPSVITPGITGAVGNPRRPTGWVSPKMDSGQVGGFRRAVGPACRVKKTMADGFEGVGLVQGDSPALGLQSEASGGAAQLKVGAVQRLGEEVGPVPLGFSGSASVALVGRGSGGLRTGSVVPPG